MSLITTINEFKLKYDSISFIIDNKLSEDVLEYYINNYTNVDWYNISAYQTLSESFIEKYIDRVWWYYISSYQTLSEQFIEKYKDKMNWSCISRFQPLSESFIETHIDKMDWCGLFNNEKIKLSYEFILKHVYDFDLYDVYIDNKNNVMVNKLVNGFLDKFEIDRIAYDFNI